MILSIKKKGDILSALFLCVFILGSAGYLWENKIENSRSLPENTERDIYFKDLFIEKLYLSGDNSAYSLSGGDVLREGSGIDRPGEADKTERVLRLAFFYQWMKEDPLMASSTMDAEKARKSVGSLKEQQDEFLKLYEKKDNIFPMDFLSRFIEASSAYSALLKEISEKNAGTLLDKMENANKAYFKEAENFYNVIASVEKNELDKKTLTFLSGDTYTDSSIVLDDISKIKENSVRIGKEIENRKKCLLESLVYCKRPLSGLAKPEYFAKEKADPDILSDKVLNLEAGIEYSGPYEVDSRCWKGFGERQYLYAAVDCTSSPGSCVEISHLATNVYYEMTELSKMPFEIYMKEQGVLLISQIATNPYVCMDLEYQPKLATIDHFYEEYKDKRFYEGLKKSDIFQDMSPEAKELIETGIKAERSFFDAKYPSEYDFEYLGNYYAYTYSYFSGKDIDINKEELLRRYMFIREKIIDIDLVINKIQNIFSGFRKKTGKMTPPSMAYVYFVRSNYSIFFLNFSSSIWRSEEKLRYMETGDKDQAGKEGLLSVYVVDYADAVDKYGEEKILEWTDIYNKSREKRLGAYVWQDN